MTNKENLEIVNSILTKFDSIRNNIFSTEELEYCNSNGYGSLDWHLHKVLGDDYYLRDVYNCLLKDYRKLSEEIKNDNN